MIIRVKPGNEAIQSGEVVLWDQHPAHFDADLNWLDEGGAFIAGDPTRPDAVYVVDDESRKVQQALAAGRLVKLSGKPSGDQSTTGGAFLRLVKLGEEVQNLERQRSDMQRWLSPYTSTQEKARAREELAKIEPRLEALRREFDELDGELTVKYREPAMLKRHEESIRRSREDEIRRLEAEIAALQSGSSVL